MELTNLTGNDYALGRTGLSLEPNDTLVVSNDSYLADTDLRSDINALFGADKVSVTDEPAGFPVATSEAGASPITRQELSGLIINEIAQSSRARLPWTTSNGPNVLVDRTDPYIPTIITAGVYYVHVTVRCAVPNPGRITPFLLEVQLDSDGFDASALSSAYVSGDILSQVSACAGFAWYLPAGANVEAWVSNQSTTDSNNFGIRNAHIQRLS